MNPRLILISLMFLSLSFGTDVIAEQKPSATQEAKKVVYKPRTRGAPKARVGGGTRSETNEDFFITVITPDEVGLTTSDQPRLFWYLSRPAEQKLLFAIVNEQTHETLLKLTFDRADAGIQSIDMADPKLAEANLAGSGDPVHLEGDVDYRWTVVVVVDGENRSNDILSSGFIRRVQPPPNLEDLNQETDELAKASALAAEGIWYDAFAAISRAVQQNPHDPHLLEQRAELLRQAGLDEVANAINHVPAERPASQADRT